MKVEFLGESPDNTAAMHILVEALLGDRIETPVRSSGAERLLGARGWPSIRIVLPSLVNALHNESNAEGLVVVADSDDSPLHDPQHDIEEMAEKDCRLCCLQGEVRNAQGKLGCRPVGAPLKVAIGVAVPAIEAWYLAGRDHEVGESAWLQANQSSNWSYLGREWRIELKRRVYGTDPSQPELRRERAEVEARRLAEDLKPLEDGFPRGFGHLAREIRSWRGG